MPKTFYNAPVYTITSIGETETIEQSITLTGTAGVNVKINVPNFVSSVCIYRSNSPDTETFLEEIVLEDTIRKQTKVSFVLNYQDTGAISPGIGNYPLTNAFSNYEQQAIPNPDYTLEEIAGSLAPSTYYYRVSFKTNSINIAPHFTKETVDVFIYKPDLSGCLVYTDSDLTLDVDYTPVADPYVYVDPFYSDVFRVGEMVGTRFTQQQEIKVGSQIIKKSVLDAIPVEIQLSNKTYLVNAPVTMVIDPPNATLEMLENKLVGTPEYFTGTVIKRYSDPGSINFYLTVRGRFIYSLSPPFFKVVA